MVFFFMRSEYNRSLRICQLLFGKNSLTAMLDKPPRVSLQQSPTWQMRKRRSLHR